MKAFDKVQKIFRKQVTKDEKLSKVFIEEYEELCTQHGFKIIPYMNYTQDGILMTLKTERLPEPEEPEMTDEDKEKFDKDIDEAIKSEGIKGEDIPDAQYSSKASEKKVIKGVISTVTKKDEA